MQISELLCSFYKCRMWASARWHNLPEVTQLEHDQVRSQLQVRLTPEELLLASEHSCLPCKTSSAVTGARLLLWLSLVVTLVSTEPEVGGRRYMSQLGLEFNLQRGTGDGVSEVAKWMKLKQPEMTCLRGDRLVASWVTEILFSLSGRVLSQQVIPLPYSLLK